MSIKTAVNRNLKNIPGKKIKRKIVVFYVDDFGSIRVKNNIAYRNLLSNGIPMDNNRFTKNDTLADFEDLSLLFNILESVKDKNNNSACFTPFTVVANPDFNKIRNSNYSRYFREPFIDTLKHYGKEYDGVFDLWKKGIEKNIFHPVYHGTEHLNIRRWMNALQERHKSTHLAFENETICIPSLSNEVPIYGLVKEFDIYHAEENESLKEDIRIGLDIFEKLFGYRSTQFTPGAATYSPVLEETLANNGIQFIDVPRCKAQPLGNNTYSRKFHYLGQKNKFNQYYIVRNCVFEPNGNSNMGFTKQCLSEIEAAFRWGKPAIISSHRINFVGHFNKKYRDTNLMQLSNLLKEIVSLWPEVEFMNGEQMAEIIYKP